eukprot:GDKJ01013220.1.p1 GENE.GDKJ01013220.1~~GDKJ01013220.1.p1  ORF type:complete len:1592 (+),score=408.78 GDKJ01013220.1:387-4778(+)
MNNHSNGRTSRTLSTFTIRHYAGDVVYTLDGGFGIHSGSTSSYGAVNSTLWLEKNNDKIAVELENIIESSSHSIVGMCTEEQQDLIDSIQRASTRNHRKEHTDTTVPLSAAAAVNSSNSNSPNRKNNGALGSKSYGGGFKSVSKTFSSDLEALIGSLSDCSTRFVRCFVPNRKGKGGKINEEVLRTQLQQSGTLDLVVIMGKGYPARVKMTELAQKYSVALTNALRCAFEKQMNASHNNRHSLSASDKTTFIERKVNVVMSTLSSDRDLVEFALRVMKIDPSQWTIGVSRLFMRAGNYAKFDALVGEAESGGVMISEEMIFEVLHSMRKKKIGRIMVIVKFAVRLQIFHRKQAAVRKMTECVFTMVRTQRVLNQWLKPALLRIRCSRMEQQRKEAVELFGGDMMRKASLRMALNEWVEYITLQNEFLVKQKESASTENVVEDSNSTFQNTADEKDFCANEDEELEQDIHKETNLSYNQLLNRPPPKFEGLDMESFKTSSPTRQLRDNHILPFVDGRTRNYPLLAMNNQGLLTAANSPNSRNAQNSNNPSTGLFLHEPYLSKKDRDIHDELWRPDSSIQMLKSSRGSELLNVVFSGTQVSIIPAYAAVKEAKAHLPLLNKIDESEPSKPVKMVPLRVMIKHAAVVSCNGEAVSRMVEGRLPAFSDGYFELSHYASACDIDMKQLGTIFSKECLETDRYLANISAVAVLTPACNENLSLSMDSRINQSVGGRFLAVEDDLSLHICEVIEKNINVKSEIDDNGIASFSFEQGINGDLQRNKTTEYPFSVDSVLKDSAIPVSSYLPPEISRGLFRTLKVCNIPNSSTFTTSTTLGLDNGSTTVTCSSQLIAILATPSDRYSFGRPIPRPLGLEASEIAIFVVELCQKTTTVISSVSPVSENCSSSWRAELIGKTSHQLPSSSNIFDIFYNGQAESEAPSALGCLDLKPLASGSGVFIIGPGIFSVFTFRGLFSPHHQTNQAALEIITRSSAANAAEVRGPASPLNRVAARNVAGIAPNQITTLASQIPNASSAGNGMSKNELTPIFSDRLIAIDCVFATHTNLPFDNVKLQWLTAAHSLYHPATEDKFQASSVATSHRPWVTSSMYSSAIESMKKQSSTSSLTIPHPLQGLEEVIVGDATGRVRTFIFRHDDYAVGGGMTSRLLQTPASIASQHGSYLSNGNSFIEVASAAAPPRLPLLIGGGVAPRLPVFRLVLHCPWTAAAAVMNAHGSSSSITAIIKHSSTSGIPVRSRTPSNTVMNSSSMNNGIVASTDRHIFSLVTQGGSVITLQTTPIKPEEAAKVATPEVIAAARARLTSFANPESEMMVESGSDELQSGGHSLSKSKKQQQHVWVRGDPDDRIHHLETRPFFEGEEVAVSAACGVSNLNDESGTDDILCLWNSSEEVAIYVRAKKGELLAFSEIREEDEEENEENESTTKLMDGSLVKNRLTLMQPIDANFKGTRLRDQ